MLGVPAGAERIEVIAQAAGQLRELGEVIAPLGAGARDAAPPPDEPAA